MKRVIGAAPCVLSPSGSPDFTSSTTRWVSPAIAAAIVGLSRSTLAKMRLRGDGPRYAKISKSVRYDIEVLEAWMRGFTIGSTAQYRAG